MSPGLFWAASANIEATFWSLALEQGNQAIAHKAPCIPDGAVICPLLYNKQGKRHRCT